MFSFLNEGYWPISRRHRTKKDFTKIKTKCIHDNLTPQTRQETNTYANLDKQVDGGVSSTFTLA